MLRSKALFRSWILQNKNALVVSTEDLGIVMLITNLLEYSERYPMTPRSSWNYYRDKIYAVDNNASVGKSFRYKTKTVGYTPAYTPLPGYPGNRV